MLARRLDSRLWALALAALLPLACDRIEQPGQPGETPPPPPAPTVTGRVISSNAGHSVAGAEVRLGAATDTTDSDGGFEFADLTPGAATLRCTAIGFGDFETVITVTSGTITHDIDLQRIEVFEFGTFALYVPAGVDATRGIILALGGPDTRGFATQEPFGAPPAVEPSLQMLGQAFRNLAMINGLAVVGTSSAAMVNAPASDQLLLAALDTAAALSGRRELSTVPVLMYGMSGGSRQASGFTVRNPERVAGLFLKVPAGVSSITSGAALRVPTYMVMAGLDAIVDTAALTAAFVGNRGAGALWALAKEPGVPHHSLSADQRMLTTTWISTILALRLPATASDPLREIAETSGWLGNHATAEAAPWASYAADRALASWLPTQGTARAWEGFVYATDYAAIGGAYDLTALITSFDSAWGIDFAGYRYTAVLTLWQEQTPRSPLRGTYADLRLIGPGGDTLVVADTGSVTSATDSRGRLLIELIGNGSSIDVTLIVSAAPSGFINGGFGCCGHIGGPFTATRRPGS